MELSKGETYSSNFKSCQIGIDIVAILFPQDYLVVLLIPHLLCSASAELWGIVSNQKNIFPESD